MILLDKVGHEVLKKGDIVRSPSGSNDWVVIDNEGQRIMIASIGKMMHKETEDLEEWYKVK